MPFRPARWAGLLFAAALTASSAHAARNLIVLIGDGLGQSQFIAARTYSQQQLGQDLHLAKLMQRRCCLALVTNDTADALVALERDRERAKREEQKQRWSNADASGFTVDDLWSAGVDLVWNVLRR